MSKPSAALAAAAVSSLWVACAATTPAPCTSERAQSAPTAGASAAADSSGSPDPDASAAKGSPRPASEATKAANAALLDAYPFSNEQDFADAKRGLIAPLPDGGVIKDAQGKVVWNLPAFADYIKQGGQAPETVNSSLWRQAQLLMNRGLFEVVPGVYQDADKFRELTGMLVDLGESFWFGVVTP